jgi:lysophospholipase L1-like esterase
MSAGSLCHFTRYSPPRGGLGEKRVLVVGDSHARRLATAMSTTWGKSTWTVYGFGLGGRTATNVFEACDNLFRTLRRLYFAPHLVIVSAGANDFLKWKNRPDGIPDMALSTCIQGLKQLLMCLRNEYPNARLLWPSPILFRRPSWPGGRGVKNSAIRAKLNATFCRAWRAVSRHGDAEPVRVRGLNNLARDGAGVHLKPDSYSVLAEALLRRLEAGRGRGHNTATRLSRRQRRSQAIRRRARAAASGKVFDIFQKSFKSSHRSINKPSQRDFLFQSRITRV